MILKKTDKHLACYKKGHLGNMPVLIVNQQVKSSLPAVLATRLTVKEIRNHSLMIHQDRNLFS